MDDMVYPIHHLILVQILPNDKEIILNNFQNFFVANLFLILPSSPHL